MTSVSVDAGNANIITYHGLSEIGSTPVTTENIINIVSEDAFKRTDFSSLKKKKKKRDREKGRELNSQ